MRAIRISRHQYLKATGLIWLNSFLILIPFVALFIAVWGMNKDRIEMLVGVAILLQAGDTLTRFHVRETVLNEEKGLLQVHLTCIVSGDKKMQFPLKGMTTSIKEYSGIARLFKGPVVVKFFDAEGNGFRLTPRYGFKPQDLLQLYGWLSSAATVG